MNYLNQSQNFQGIQNYEDYNYYNTFQEYNQIDNDTYFFQNIHNVSNMEDPNLQAYEPEKQINSIENQFNQDERYEEDNNILAKDNNIKPLINEYNTYLQNDITKTKMTTNLLNKKTKRSNGDCDMSNEKTNSFEKNDEKKKTKQGRKKKEEKEKGNHTKYSDDNIMRKIKSKFLTLSHNLLNESLNDKNLEFLKLESSVNENLKKQYNLDLLDKKMKDLYYESEISSKYRKQSKVYADKNKKLIDKIFHDNEKLQTIKILNLTYRDLFNVFRKKLLTHINYDLRMKIKDISLLEKEQYNNIYLFFNEVEKQEQEKNETKENIDIYLNNMKELCMNYESWFLNKKGRNRVSKLKNNNIEN